MQPENEPQLFVLYQSQERQKKRWIQFKCVLTCNYTVAMVWCLWSGPEWGKNRVFYDITSNNTQELVARSIYNSGHSGISRVHHIDSLAYPPLHN